jgi:hypothetical protein
MSAAHKQVIEDDGWVPLVREQWEGMRHAPEMVGARALAYAVVAEAWSMATRELRPLSPGKHSKFIRRKHRTERMAQHEARRWFNCNTVEPFTFLYLCHHLDLNPGQIRRALGVALERRDQSPLVPTVSSSSQSKRL